MKWFNYLLILLIFCPLVDDCWAMAPVLPSAPLTDNDADEYLPSHRRMEEDIAVHKQPALASLKTKNANGPLARKSLPSNCSLTGPFTPPLLDLFMSLQI